MRRPALLYASEEVPIRSLNYPQLRRALSCRLVEVGDFFELADVVSARAALEMAAAVEAELSSGACLAAAGFDEADGTARDDR
jgi:hypothetical protein